MNPVILYPQNATQAKHLQEFAKKEGLEMGRVSQKAIEDLDNMLFAERMKAAETGRLGTYDELKATFKRLISDLEK